MYCTRCNRYTDNNKCPECGRETLEEAPHVVYWCDTCKVPVIHVPVGNKTTCPTCGNEAKYLCADIRPVFPEERLLFELLAAEPYAYIHESVWAIGSKYYVNGEPHNITIAEILSFDPKAIRKQLDCYSPSNDDTAFRHYVKKFVKTNRAHKDEIVHEACDFIVEASKGYAEENLVVSFSGVRIRP